MSIKYITTYLIMNTGKRIQEIAKSKGLTAKMLGEMVGRTPQSIFDIYGERVSINVKLLKKVAKALDEPIYNFFIESPDDYYDMMPNVIPMEEIHKFMFDVHEHAKNNMGMFHLRIHKSSEGMYILESVFAKLEERLDEEDLIKLGNQVYESIRISSPKLTREEKSSKNNRD